MFHLCWMSAILSAAPTVAPTTLLTQCTPYFRPIPTVLPLTFTNPLLPLSPEAPQLHLNNAYKYPDICALPPLPPQVHSLASSGTMSAISAESLHLTPPPEHLHACRELGLESDHRTVLETSVTIHLSPLNRASKGPAC